MKNPWRKNLKNASTIPVLSVLFRTTQILPKEKYFFEKLALCYEIKIEQNKMKLSDSSINLSHKMIRHSIRDDFPAKIKI